MTESIKGVRSIGHDHYIRQTERTAWRREMLSQMLEKVREAQPAAPGKQLAATSGPPPKGSLLDIII